MEQVGKLWTVGTVCRPLSASWSAGTVAAMGKPTIRILCEVQAAGDSLTGFASRNGGDAWEFTGWLGLLGVLQAMLAETDPHDAPPHPAESASTPTDPSEGGNE